jgi:hypothetical protein
MDTTGKALVDFWKWAGTKGKVNPNTAGAMRAACSQVLGVLDNWETLDVSKLNVDDVFRRFVNKRSRDFTAGSLGTYKNRFKKALSEFLANAKDPESWKPSSQERPATKRKEKAAAVAASKNGNGNGSAETHDDALPGRVGLIEYPYVLGGGRFAYLRLPVDLKMVDVRRLVAYLHTLPDDAEVA